MYTLKDFNVKRVETKLSSGTPVVLFERPNTPVNISVLFLAGSRFDKNGYEGTAHFLEHMLLAGSKDFPTKDKLAAFIEDLGGGSGASTGHDSLNIGISIGSATDLESAIYLLSEEILHPLFNEKTMENERGAILRELGSKRTSPVGTLSEISNQLIFQNTEIGRSILGTEESIKAISKEVLLNFYKEHINADSFVIVVAGGTDIETLKNLLEKYLILPTHEKPQFPQDLPIYRNKYTTCEFFKGNSLNVTLDFRAVNFKSKDLRPLSLLSSILGGGRTGALTKRLRYEKGLVYGVGADNSCSIDFGVFGISTSLAKSNLQEVMDIISKEIVRIKQSGPTTEELNLVKNRITKSTLRTMQTSGDWVGFHRRRILFYPEEIWTLENYLKEVAETTLEDIKRVANQYLTTDNYYLSATGEIDEDTLNQVTVPI